MKKLLVFILILAGTATMQACNSSNGDRAKSGESDTVGTKTSGGYAKDSTNNLKDTLKH